MNQVGYFMGREIVAVHISRTETERKLGKFQIEIKRKTYKINVGVL